MIKGRVYGSMDKKFILSKVSDYDIFRYALGEFPLNKAILSPLRADRNPSFSIRVSKSGELYWIDYGDNTRGDSFDLVAALFHLTFNNTLKKIGADLGLKSSTGAYKEIIASYKQPARVRKLQHILVKPRQFTKEELS